MVAAKSSGPKFEHLRLKMPVGYCGRCTGFTASKMALCWPKFSGWKAASLHVKLSENWFNPEMKPSQALATHRAEIRDIVLAHRAENARVFGSAALGTDTDDSDLDILVDPTPDTTLFDLGAIRYKIRTLLGVPVDVLTPNSLPDHFRQKVISEAVCI